MARRDARLCVLTAVRSYDARTQACHNDFSLVHTQSWLNITSVRECSLQYSPRCTFNNLHELTYTILSYREVDIVF